MKEPVPACDAVVIGGGFYGATIAAYLAAKPHMKRVVLVEQESELMLRASYNNQARVHNGYHYPRSFTTAFRSRVNLPRFVQDWPSAVVSDFVKVYAIARHGSKVTAKQFFRFCQRIGADVEVAPPEIKRMFSEHFIEEVFLVTEYAFNSNKLAQSLREQLVSAGVEVHLNTRATSICRGPANRLRIGIESGSSRETLEAPLVFNCTYSGLNQFSGDFVANRAELKHEITEMALVKVPKALEDVGITVMDGAFASVMPFPDRQLHTLSHVRYTPRLQWKDEQGKNPYAMLDTHDRASRFGHMRRSVERYIPALEGVTHEDSLFEVKTVLAQNEGNDGRPILWEQHETLPGLYSVLGGKIDNIYDALEMVDTIEALDAPNPRMILEG